MSSSKLSLYEFIKAEIKRLDECKSLDKNMKIWMIVAQCINHCFLTISSVIITNNVSSKIDKMGEWEKEWILVKKYVGVPEKTAKTVNKFLNKVLPALNRLLAFVRETYPDAPGIYLADAPGVKYTDLLLDLA